jgi:cytochrome c-type biogenesis protein CcmH
MVAISEELRCLVCQNESLAASQRRTGQGPAPRDPRADPATGQESTQEILDFMVSRYGDFVRYRPPLKGTTLLLWFGPRPGDAAVLSRPARPGDPRQAADRR